MLLRHMLRLMKKVKTHFVSLFRADESKYGLRSSDTADYVLKSMWTKFGNRGFIFLIHLHGTDFLLIYIISGISGPLATGSGGQICCPYVLGFGNCFVFIARKHI